MTGTLAPDFTLEGSDGRAYALRDLRGGKIVLIFYVLNRTPG